MQSTTPEIHFRDSETQDSDYLVNALYHVAKESQGTQLDLNKIRNHVALYHQMEKQYGFHIIGTTPIEKKQVIIVSAMIQKDNPQSWWAESAYIEPAFRGRKLLRKLVQYMDFLALKNKVKSLSLYVHRDNIVAKNMYLRVGFEVTPTATYSFYATQKDPVLANRFPCQSSASEDYQMSHNAEKNHQYSSKVDKEDNFVCIYQNKPHQTNKSVVWTDKSGNLLGYVRYNFLICTWIGFFCCVTQIRLHRKIQQSEFQKSLAAICKSIAEIKPHGHPINCLTFMIDNEEELRMIKNFIPGGQLDNYEVMRKLYSEMGNQINS